MDLGVRGKRVVVTAASKGLGFAIAKRYAMEGAHVVLCSRGEAHVEEALEGLHASVAQAHVQGYVCDVQRREEVAEMFTRIRREQGTIDILVNNAGGPVGGQFDEMKEEDWETAFQLTLMSVVRCTKEALVDMRASRWGRIINIASTSVRQPLDDLILSNTFRLAVVGLAKSLANEVADAGILVNTVCPGRIDTDRIRYIDGRRQEAEGLTEAEILADWAKRIPVGRYGDPDEFANVAVFLGSAANSYMTGQTVLVDGGMVRAI